MKVAVLIPCYNESRTIGEVVRSFRKELSEADIYVYDNNSTDDTAGQARAAGAVVRSSPRPGKGRVVRQMFAEVAADVYLLVDGDGTYLAQDSPRILAPVMAGECEMCVADRLVSHAPGSFPSFHKFGNKLIGRLTERLYRVRVGDILSGYRALSRWLVDELCLVSSGFEIETEITVKAVWLGARLKSVASHYTGRPAGSHSKLKTFSDGYRVLFTLLTLLREYQPVTMGGLVFIGLAGVGLLLALIGGARGSLFMTVSGWGLILGGLIILATGVVLHAINISAREQEERDKKILGSSRGGAAA